MTPLKALLIVLFMSFASSHSRAANPFDKEAGPVVGKVFCDEDLHLGQFAWNTYVPEIVVQDQSVRIRFEFAYQRCIKYMKVTPPYKWVKESYPHYSFVFVSDFPTKKKQRRIGAQRVETYTSTTGMSYDLADGEYSLSTLLDASQKAAFDGGKQVEKVLFVQMALPKLNRPQDLPSDSLKKYWLSWGTKRLHILFDKTSSNFVRRVWYSEEL